MPDKFGCLASNYPCWFVYQQRNLEFFFPQLAKSVDLGLITPEQARERALLVITMLVRVAIARFGLPHSWTAYDLVADVEVRLAEARIMERFDPTRGSPHSLLRGVVTMIVRERTCRRQPPRPCSLEWMAPVVCDDQLSRAELNELKAKLQNALKQLSKGEIQALLHEYGRFFDYSSPSGPRRRPRDPEALPRAIALLRQLMRSD